MLEGGEIMIPGVGLEATFYKGLFDKIGVKADYVQIGEYKGADEEYTRTEASPELKGELNQLTESSTTRSSTKSPRSRNLARKIGRRQLSTRRSLPRPRERKEA